MRAASDEAARFRFPPCCRTLAVTGSWQGPLGGRPALPCRPISPPKSLKIGASLSPRLASALVAGFRDPGFSGFRLSGLGPLCRRSCTSAGVCPLDLCGLGVPSCFLRFPIINLHAGRCRWHRPAFASSQRRRAAYNAAVARRNGRMEGRSDSSRRCAMQRS